MDKYRFLEYRPGRWIKVDAQSGEFIGPASAREALAWQRAQGSLAGPARAPDTIVPTQAAPQGTDETTAVAPREQPPQVERGAQPEAETTPEPEAPPQPEAEEESQPEASTQPATEQEPQPETPTQPEAEGEPQPQTPTQPETGKEAQPETPTQPETTKEPGPQPPAQPQPEGKAAPQPPEQQKPKPPAPAKRPRPLQGLGTGAAQGLRLCWPLPKRYRISCDFHGHKKRKPPSKAPGIDLACPMRTDVLAWAAGKVIRSRWSAKGGRSLWIDHGHGFKTYYAHLNCAYVLEGEAVKVGQKIGESGNTGNSTGPHLHFSVVRGGRYVDPEKLLVFEQAGKA